MNLTNVTLWFDDGIHYYGADTLIPSTVIRFSGNFVLDVNSFHINLIYLNVYVCSFVHLLEIVQHTPNIQQLSITFADNFPDQYSLEKYRTNRLQAMIVNFRCLSNLTSLSLTTKPSHGMESNERLPVNHIEFFIDEYLSEQKHSEKNHLLAVDCDLTFVHGHRNTISEVMIGNDMFNYVRFFRFISHCWYRECVCHDLLPRLLDRMPHLQSLITSEDSFIPGQRPLPPIKRLNLRQCEFKSFDTLVYRLPHLSMLLFGHMTEGVEELSQLLRSLFIGIPSLELIFFKNGPEFNTSATSYEKTA